MIKAILIDIGKTIITNEAFDYKIGLNAIYTLSKNKEKCTFEKYLSVYNESFDIKKIRENGDEVSILKMIEVVNEKCGLQFDISLEEMEDVFLKSSTVEGLIPQVIDFLDYVTKKGILVYAVSNSMFSGPCLSRQLQSLGAEKYLSGVLSSADILRRKPYKEIFLEGIKRVQEKNKQIEKEEIVYLGNDYNIDMVGSYNVGLKPVWINHNHEEDKLNICYYNESSYSELIGRFK